MKMFKFLSLAILAVMFVCNTAYAANNKETLVEVIVFHGVKQCETCKAIKANSQDVVASQFQNPGKNKKVVYRVIDFSKPENKKIAEKYEIAWTSLVLVKHQNGKETVNNISKFAIKNARTNTSMFKKQLAKDIKKMLK